MPLGDLDLFWYLSYMVHFDWEQNFFLGFIIYLSDKLQRIVILWLYFRNFVFFLDSDLSSIYISFVYSKINIKIWWF
jgi:hypothetical protein